MLNSRLEKNYYFLGDKFEPKYTIIIENELNLRAKKTKRNFLRKNIHLGLYFQINLYFRS